MSKPQDYETHRRYVPAYHFGLSLLVLAVLIGSIVNVVKTAGTPGFYSATLILAISIALVLIFYFTREFALRAQDRVIRAEENLRHYIRTGNLLDPRLTIRQIIGLRFAPDEEFDALMATAIDDRLGEDQIKRLIKNWRSDDYRV